MALVLWLIVLSEFVWMSGSHRHEVIKLPLASEMPLKLLNWAAWLCQRELVKNNWTQRQWLSLFRSKEDCVPDLQLSPNPIPTLQDPGQINPLLPGDLIKCAHSGSSCQTHLRKIGADILGHSHVWALVLHPRKPSPMGLLLFTCLSLSKEGTDKCSSSSAGPAQGWEEAILCSRLTQEERESSPSRRTDFVWTMSPNRALCIIQKHFLPYRRS